MTFSGSQSCDSSCSSISDQYSMRLHKQIRTLFQHRAGIRKCRFEELLQWRDYPAHKRNCEPTGLRHSSSLGVVWARCCDSPASLQLPPFDNKKASKTNTRQLPGRTTRQRAGERFLSVKRRATVLEQSIHPCGQNAVAGQFVQSKCNQNLLFYNIRIIITDFRRKIR